MQNNFENDIDQDTSPSKTQRKQEMLALQKIGERLVVFDVKQLNELNLPGILMSAILEAKLIQKHGARRRQMQYIGKLMRNIDIEPIQEKLATWNNAGSQHKIRLHLLEHWRERLLTDGPAFTEFSQKYPVADIQRLRLLVRNAHKEKLAKKTSKSYRSLFQELQATIPEID